MYTVFTFFLFTHFAALFALQSIGINTYFIPQKFQPKRRATVVQSIQLRISKEPKTRPYFLTRPKMKVKKEGLSIQLWRAPAWYGNMPNIRTDDTSRQ